MFGNAKLEDILFEVSERPVFVPEDIKEDGTFSKVTQFEGKKALMREDTGQQLGIVGENWTPVLNQRVFDNFDEICKKSGIHYDVGECLSKSDGAKTSIEIIFPDMKIETGKGDTMELRGYLNNGFDGMTSVGLEMGFFRYWCSNGAIVGSKDYQFKFKHTNSAEGRLIDSFQFYMENQFAKTKTFVDKLSSTHISDEQVKKELEEQDLVAYKKYEDDLMNAYETEKKDSPQTLWLMYNIYTRVITHALQVESFRKLSMLNALTKRAKNVWLNN